MARDFTDILSAVWAANALTTIPNPPIPGQAYRNTAITDGDLSNGQQYSEVYDSARYNQLLYLLSGCVKMLMETGIPEWSAEQNYQQNAYTIGSDGKLYGPAKKASGPDNGGAVDPVTDAVGEATTWTLSLPDFEAPLTFDAAEGKVKLSVGNTTTVTDGKLETKIDPNGGLQSSATGVGIKPVASGPVTVDANGVNVRTFTAPTASAPGKAGLVPGPPATKPYYQSMHYMASDAKWWEFDLSCMAPDKVRNTNRAVPGFIGLGGDNADANILYAGRFSSIEWKNTPFNSGFLFSYQAPSNDLEAYAIVQLFHGWNGESYLRSSNGDTHNGNVVTKWMPWILLGAPRPKTAEGVGQWKAISGTPGANNLTLPAGGVWTYLVQSIVVGQGTIGDIFSGVAPGGTLITATISNSAVQGFAWRIA